MRARSVYVAEPSAAYRVKLPIVVDCSVFGALFFDENLREATAQLVARRILHAPWLLDRGIANVADKKRRRPGAALVDAELTHYEEHEVHMRHTSPADALALAAAYSLCTCDAAYLALASQMRAPLVTFDHKRDKAATRHLGSLE